MVKIVVMDYNLKYYDCTKPENLKLFNKVCVNENSVENGDMEEWTLLQIEQSVETNGWSCQARKSTFEYYCGAFSHVKIMKIPSIDVPVSLTPEHCRMLVTTQSIGLPFLHTPTAVKLGGETIISVSAHGLIHDTEKKVSCEGESLKVGDTIIDEVLELDQWRITILQEEFRYSIGDAGPGRIMTRFTHDLLPQKCAVSDGGCVTERTYIWDVPYGRGLCQLVEVQQLKLTSINEGKELIDPKRRLVFKNEGMVELPQGCPSGQMMKTGWDMLRLTKVKDGFHKLKGDELDITLYSDVADSYLEMSLENKLNQLDNKLHHQLCKTSTVEANRIQRTMDGRFTTRLGDAVAVFTCPEKIGKIVIPEEGCYNKVPVENGQFVDLRTRVGSSSAERVPCNRHFPMMVLTNENEWVTLGNTITRVERPANLHEKGGQLFEEDFIKQRGIYSKQEIAAWETMAGWGDVRESVASKITMGVMNTEDRDYQFPSYNLALLEAGVKRELNPWENLMETVENYTGLLCVAILCGWIVQFGVTISILLWTLTKDGLSAAASVCFTLCCTGPHLIVRAHRRMRRQNMKRTAEMELEVTDVSAAELLSAKRSRRDSEVA